MWPTAVIDEMISYRPVALNLVTVIGAVRQAVNILAYCIGKTRRRENFKSFFVSSQMQTTAKDCNHDAKEAPSYRGHGNLA